MDFPVLDAHTHCGMTVPFEELSGEWQLGGIDGGVVFSPVEEIYDRYDSFFVDSDEYRHSRRQVHDYLVRIASGRNIFPFFFVWNDFVRTPDAFVGIKWHRHPGEPVYFYDSPRCHNKIDEICSKRLPITLEEEFANTLKFVKEIAQRTVIIIPHMGGLNGGYYRLKKAGLFENETVWVDTALASRQEIEDFAETYGIGRMMFGSDYPFGIPASEKRKVEACFAGNDLRSVLSGNLLKLLGVSLDAP
ncbi:MAG TPA: amidohydrolase family protein [Desulfomonilaceae bacterium]|nr:amidohydrolase family protein [Desulfomonilaceae bacterium]